MPTLSMLIGPALRFVVGLTIVFGWIASGVGQEAHWIWTPDQPRHQAPAGDCYFRKSLQLESIEQATITITADDRYDLYVNGRLIGHGRSVQQMEQYDVSRLLQKGNNVIAVRVSNLEPGPAALAARVFVKPRGKSWLSYSSDESWRSSTAVADNWASLRFNDARWQRAAVLGVLGETPPWDRPADQPETAKTAGHQRFRIDPEFVVEEILPSDQVGSLINLAFNEFGHLIVSQEGGPLLLIYDSNQDGTPDKIREYGSQVENIQGILPLNGEVYVTGEGDQGPGVYRLMDDDHNGSIDRTQRIVGFKGTAGEHGAHGLVFGPDGLIYCVLGNHVQYDGDFAETSPLRNLYEGDLVQPRLEDPGGHAHGITAPGGTVIRFDTEGQRVELVAGGLRNAYDLAFDTRGYLFVHDSDMEADEGAAWYRPTALYEIAEAGEYGWRSGWAAWPSYYFDRLPPTLETGRGSPTGSCVYGHHMFPRRYHGSLFLADWSQGQILSVKWDEASGISSEVFLKGQPLNVTDLAVGPDGWLYFCTGGRGTKGGIYRVRWLGKVPDSVSNQGEGLARALRQPQLDSAWGRQAVATLKRELGAQWNSQLIEFVTNEDTSADQRVRALELMQLLGSAPGESLLAELIESDSSLVRARAARLMGLHEINPVTQAELSSLLADSSPPVRLAAAEALLRAGYEVNPTALVPLLGGSDRRLAWTARRLLERTPLAQWKDLLKHEDQRVQLQAGLALVTADPSRENCLEVLDCLETMLQSFISDRNFADVLRLIQVALHRSGLTGSDLPELAKALAVEYPVGEMALNRELFRILTYLHATEVVPKAIESLDDESLAFEDRMHIATHLSLMKHDWTTEQRFAVVKFFEQSQTADAGSSVPLYVMQLTRRLCQNLSIEEARVFVAEGAKWPNAALVSLYCYPDKLAAEDIESLKKLDQEIDGKGFEAEQFKRLRTGIVAMLAQHGDADCQAYLREIWIRSPERRQSIALGLAQFPNDENWDYMVRSLPLLETFAVEEVIAALCKVPIATDDAAALREVILHGLRMLESGESPAPALRLLSYWVGEETKNTADSPAQRLEWWQAWFAERYPNETPAVLPQLDRSSPWNIETLSEYLATSDGRKGSAEAGKEIYRKAQCADCHRAGELGQAIGPDLTSVAGRFTRKEMLESILFPSHIISDQYRSHQVLTVDGKILHGMLTRDPETGAAVIRDSQLREHRVEEEDIDTISPSKISLMPSGLLDNLTAAEIRDLLTFLGYLPEQARQAADSADALNR